jgi:hypothetical protein
MGSVAPPQGVKRRICMDGRHPVLAEIANRGRGAVGSGSRLALAVEGGGMRGVVSAGMLFGLHDLGVGPPFFDEIFGASAGAMNAALHNDELPQALPLQLHQTGAHGRRSRRQDHVSGPARPRAPRLVGRHVLADNDDAAGRRPRGAVAVALQDHRGTSDH